MEKVPLKPGEEVLESLIFGPGSEFCNWTWKTGAFILHGIICQHRAVVCVWHQLPFLTLPKVSFVEQCKKRAPHALVVTCLRRIYISSSRVLIFWSFFFFFLILLKINVCQELNDFERLQHNFFMHVAGKEKVLKFLLKHFNASVS